MAKRGRKTRQLEVSQVNQVLDMYLNNKMPITVISKKLNIPGTHIKRVLAEHNIVVTRGRRGYFTQSPETIKRIIGMYRDDNMTMGRIAYKIGCSQGTVRNILTRNKIPINPNIGWKNKYSKDEHTYRDRTLRAIEILNSVYLFPLHEIGYLFGISRERVRQLLNYNGAKPNKCDSNAFYLGGRLSELVDVARRTIDVASSLHDSIKYRKDKFNKMVEEDDNV